MHPTDGRSSHRRSARSSRFPKLVACITATFGARRSSTPAGLPRHRPAPLVPLFLLAILRAPENFVSAGNVDIGRARALRDLVPVPPTYLSERLMPLSGDIRDGAHPR